jgi:hypothetical protein
VETVRHFFEVFAGNAELPEVAAPADRDEDAARAERRSPGNVDEERVRLPLDAFRAERLRLDARGVGLRAQLVDERLLHVGGDAELSRRSHRLGVRVDRLRLREVDDRGEGFGRFKDGVGEPAPLGLERGGHSGDAGADDHEVEGLRIARAR